MNEFDIIDRYFKPLTSTSNSDFASMGLMDDAALIKAPNSNLVVTTDSLVAGVHFFGFETGDLIARKALRTNLSDLASKGATPNSYTLNLHLSDQVDETWLSAFCDGLARDQKLFGVSLLGGDTVKSDTLALSITAFGIAGEIYPSRSKAQIDDDIWLTGSIGDSALGLRFFDGRWSTPTPKPEQENTHADYLKQRYLMPQPRLELQDILKLANASMDVSDGLIADLSKMMHASGLYGRLQGDKLPLSPAAQWALKKFHSDELHQGLHPSLFEGDDYEIVFTASPDRAQEIQDLAASLPFDLSKIGTVIGSVEATKQEQSDCKSEGQSVYIVAWDGSHIPMSYHGHQHKI